MDLLPIAQAAQSVDLAPISDGLKSVALGIGAGLGSI